ncbi:hypothetical protein WJX72_006351 [[Myrmecia] bisecta]|uniref:5-methyltetrahydropteroyltriglutamate--homocysteine S-methyltransferase n=1 Tax=[Myrmecia] bisecta TaxID=41462 RepID=A0AAW1R6X3_9CHLO
MTSKVRSACVRKQSVRPFGSQFATPQNQGGGNAFSLAGNIPGLHSIQGNYNMQNTLPGGRPGLGGLPGAGQQQQQQQQSTAQGRFAGANLAGNLQQLGQYGQGPARGGMAGHPLALNGLAGNAVARGAVGSAVGPNPNRPGLDRGNSGTVNLAGLGGGMQRPGNVQGLQGMNLGALGNRGIGGMAGLGIAGQLGGAGGLGGGLGMQAGSPMRSNAMHPSLGGGSGISSAYNPSGDLLAMINKAGVGGGGNTAVGQAGGGQLGGLTAGTGYGSVSNQQGIGGQALGQSGLGGGQDTEQPAFDSSEFPALGTGQRQQPAQGNSLANGDGTSLVGAELYGNLARGGLGPNNEFSIQNEEFPALPGASAPPRTGEGEQGQDQQQAQGPQSSASSPHLQQFGGVGGRGTLPALRSLHSSTGSDQVPGQGQGFGELPASLLQSLGASGLGGSNPTQEQMLRYYYQQQQERSLRAAGQAPARPGAPPVGQPAAAGPQAATPDRFGLLGLLSVIRMTDADLTTLALGTDLTTLGLHLNSPENVYKTFASPWADAPLRPEPEFKVPACYLHNPPRLQPGYFSKFQQDTLFYIFYSMPSDEAQLFAADELASRGWWFHKEFKVWLTRIPNTEPLVKADRYERGSYFVFDTNTWECVRKDNFVLHYDALERAPNLPRPGPLTLGHPLSATHLSCPQITGKMAITTATIGFPRIGPNREMKKALESYWKGQESLDELLAVSAKVEQDAWQLQHKAGVKLIGLDGTLYDQVLDWVFFLGLAPARFQHLSGYDLYFAMARGAKGTVALDMSKYFDTNYHFMVPELDDTITPKPDFSNFLDKVKRGQAAVGQASAVPMIVGPNTLVGLATGKADRKAAVQRLLPAYVALLKELKALGVPEVQLQEPILTTSNAAALRPEFEATFEALSKEGVPINLVTFYDDIAADVYDWVVKLPVAAISLDFLGVPGSALGCNTAALVAQKGFPADKRLGAGIVDGRSVWADDGTASALLAALRKQGIHNISVQSSVSLQHLPYDKELEKALPGHISKRLAFATQKLQEIVSVAEVASKTPVDAQATKLPSVAQPESQIEQSQFRRSQAYEARREQQIQMPAFPTSTIGSFPQTPEIRRARLLHKKGALSAADYDAQIRAYIEYSVREQERIGVDVLVHGEPERTDMVEFFGQRLEGFCFTEAGWVQSYGSRYVRPPIIHGDVARRAPMTIKEFEYAQSLTDRPVKGMLTGPVTILNWSFPRKDLRRQAQAFQLALALRGEVADLEAAGCKVIQVDEPALREGLPLKKECWASYLAWAVDAFRLSTAVAQPATQIVTHLCYSDFQDILEAIAGLDADVLTIENSRSGNEMILALAAYGYKYDIGPGCYDVHSPVVPSVEFMKGKIQSYLDSGILGGRADRIWVNPDCGLKTREWSQVIPALENMVQAAAEMRAQVQA